MSDQDGLDQLEALEMKPQRGKIEMVETCPEDGQRVSVEGC